MKNVLTICALALLFIATACNKDDDMECNDLMDVIVGNWDVSVPAVGTEGEVTFNDDGTFIDESDILVGGEINGDTLDMKTYTLEGDTLLNLKAEGETGQNVSTSWPVLSFDCDNMTFEAQGLEINVEFDRQ
jgi:hypothetical protein